MPHYSPLAMVIPLFPRSNYRGFFTTGESYCPMNTLCTVWQSYFCGMDHNCHGTLNKSWMFLFSSQQQHFLVIVVRHGMMLISSGARGQRAWQKWSSTQVLLYCPPSRGCQKREGGRHLPNNGLTSFLAGGKGSRGPCGD